MTNFEQYLQLYGIDPIRLSIEARVRYLTIYNAKKGNPIMPENARKIKEAVFRLTGMPYTGSFALIEMNDKQFLPIYVKRLPKNQQHS